MKKVLLALVVLLVLGAAGAAGVWWYLEQQITAFAAAPFGGAGVKTVEIPAGTNPKGVASLLQQGGVISDADLGYKYLRREKLGPKLKAGEYEFEGALTPVQAFEKVMSGQVKTYHFTVPEGLRVDEILPILGASELKLDLVKLQKLAADSKFVRGIGVPADGLEGFLFPDTYSFTRGANEEKVLGKMVARTIEEFKKAPRAPGVSFNLLQGITLASIIEKETGASELDQRAHISCVFHNRLKRNERLDTDPTVIYSMFLMSGKYNKNIRRKDLETDHPYNTYRNKGLPPGPIASPGAAAIEAALKPIDCNDMFFVSKNDGTSVFCPDLKCHEAAVDKYQRQPFQKKKKEPEGETQSPN